MWLAFNRSASDRQPRIPFLHVHITTTHHDRWNFRKPIEEKIVVIGKNNYAVVPFETSNSAILTDDAGDVGGHRRANPVAICLLPSSIHHHPNSLRTTKSGDCFCCERLRRNSPEAEAPNSLNVSTPANLKALHRSQSPSPLFRSSPSLVQAEI